LDVALVGGLAIVFDFYKASDDKSVQLYLPKGVAIPGKVASRKWEYQFEVRDPGSVQWERIQKQGYFMCRLHDDTTSWTEL
jgi:hypothetical protein